MSWDIVLPRIVASQVKLPGIAIPGGTILLKFYNYIVKVLSFTSEVARHNGCQWTFVAKVSPIGQELVMALGKAAHLSKLALGMEDCSQLWVAS